MVEGFWDGIYRDLEPFWGVEPGLVIERGRGFEMRIGIRGGKAESGSDWPWTQAWLGLIKSLEGVEGGLPDMDLALNAMDEPRVMVPWEEVERLMRKAGETRSIADRRMVVGTWRTLPEDGEAAGGKEAAEVRWERDKHYWPIARRGCPPESKARQVEVQKKFDRTPRIASSWELAHMREGYVENYTMSTDFCHQPDLQGLNGAFVKPLSVSTTATIFPMFGGSKLSANNDILLPPPVYWTEEARFMGSADDASFPWTLKFDMALWRGVATGGKNTRNNWKAFQRHRFVAMNNGTKLSDAEEGIRKPINFAMPDERYDLKAQADGRLGEWVDAWSDVAFTDLMCEDNNCDYTSPQFLLGNSVTMAEQFQHKFLPDIDGNSFSGRYLGFLRSTSLPIKATLWKEWHDDRLVAWKHFVPMDNRYADWYGIMEYFLGYGEDPGRDEIARRIAMSGREWASKVLRKEDMQIYVLRLLLEYARICDERRENLGWVEDLSRWM